MVNDLARLLRLQGFPVQEVAWSSDPSSEDDAVVINNAVSVRESGSGFIVQGWEDAQTMRSWPARRTPTGKFLQDLREAIDTCPITLDTIALHANWQVERAHAMHTPNGGPYTVVIELVNSLEAR